MRSTRLKTSVSDHEIAVIWSASTVEGDPGSRDLVNWAQQALAHQGVAPCEMAIKIVEPAESRALNHQYRGKDAPTNVLSFPLDGGMPDKSLLLGDLAICADIVRAEAAQQEKTVAAHFAHMTVHGIMHLMGFDHVDEAEAEEMEQIEIKILHTIGFPDPYEYSDAG
jgi:probable rRNA maturation factor